MSEKYLPHEKETIRKYDIELFELVRELSTEPNVDYKLREKACDIIDAIGVMNNNIATRHISSAQGMQMFNYEIKDKDLRDFLLFHNWSKEIWNKEISNSKYIVDLFTQYMSLQKLINIHILNSNAESYLKTKLKQVYKEINN